MNKRCIIQLGRSSSIVVSFCLTSRFDLLYSLIQFLEDEYKTNAGEYLYDSEYSPTEMTSLKTSLYIDVGDHLSGSEAVFSLFIR
jgi:hypothetical protein